MSALFASPWKALAAGLVLAALLFLIYLLSGGGISQGTLAFLVRWLHVVSAIIWVGLIWFVNFVQLPALMKTDDAGRGAIMSAIAPGVAWWFRHTASLTILAGLALAYLNGYLIETLSIGATDGFSSPRDTMLGIGMWLGIAMWGLVWFVIWPNLKILFGHVPADDAARAAARTRVRNFARKNLILSIPVIFAMVAAQNLF